MTATPISPEHPDNSFMLFDSNEDGEDESSRILIFASADMRFKASIATELFADGTYRVVPRGFATLYTIHSVIDGVPYPVFFCLTKDERENTFMRVLSVAKPYLTRFDTSCVVHTDCQRSAINAFRQTFGCRVNVVNDNAVTVRHYSDVVDNAVTSSRVNAFFTNDDNHSEPSSMTLTGLQAASLKTGTARPASLCRQ